MVQDAGPERERKFSVGERVRGKADAPASFTHRVGTVVEIGPGVSEYGVTFDDNLHTDHVQSNWMELDTLGAAE
jgi:hypothetical protein